MATKNTIKAHRPSSISPVTLTTAAAVDRRKRRGQHKCFRAAAPLVEQMESRLMLSAMLLSDIIPGTTASNPSQFTPVGDSVFFVATSGGTSNYELWKTDGTAAGTSLVKDINPVGNGLSSTDAYLTNVNGTLFFAATDNASGVELWKSDGTAGGTVRVQDIRVGTTGSTPSELTNVNGTLFFAANDGSTGVELWKSTGSGAALVSNINGTGASSSPSYLTNVNGTLFFAATAAGGTELWKSDGTAGGTVRVHDIYLGTNSSNPSNLTNVGGTLYFVATTSADGTELWKSDGTVGTTLLVTNIRSGSASGLTANSAYLTNVNGTLFFAASNGTTGNAEGLELWTSDGTAGGTFMVRDIRPGKDPSMPAELTEVGGRLYFTATNGTNGVELWTSNGTSAGTVLVKDIYSGGTNSNPSGLVNVGGVLFFAALDPNGTELWRSDGTGAGTVIVKNINAGNSSSSPTGLVNANGTLYFAATDGSAHGVELWVVAPPTAQAGGPYSMNEGASVSLSGAGSSDPDPTETLSYAWDLDGDGTFGETGAAAANGDETGATPTFTATDGPGVATISLRVSNSTGLSSTATATVSIANVAPTLAISGASVTNDGSTYTLNLSSSDAGPDTISSWTIDWGDGNIQTVGGNPSSVTHVYVGTGSDYTISASATDEDGTYAAANTLAVHVNGAAPQVAAATNSGTRHEGSSYSFNLGSFTDASGQGNWTVDIDWGDGSAHAVFTVSSTGALGALNHTYADSGSYSLTTTVTNGNGDSGMGVSTISITDVAPAVSISGPASVNAGDVYTLDLSVGADPGTDTISSWTINWGDGNIQTISGNPASVTHTYASGGNRTISASATDEDGAYAAASTLAVQVTVGAPVVTPGSITGTKYEGASYSFDLGSFGDPDGNGKWDVQIDWGDGSARTNINNLSNPGAIPARTHTYADNGSYTLTVYVTDKAGNTGSASSTLTITNALPVVTAGTNTGTKYEGGSYSFSLGSFTDAGSSDSPWTIDIDWGDGSAHTIFSVTSIGSLGARTHTYADNGSYTITTTVTDADGDSGSASSGVSITNVAPTLSISGPASVNEGSAHTLTLSSSDPGADTITSWTVNWGDGNIQTISGNPASVTHVYLDGPDSYTISASATDEEGVYAAGNTAAVAVNNLGPVVSLGGAATVNEGSSYTLDLSAIDPGGDAITVWMIYWGDSPAAQAVFGSVSSVTHVYADGPGAYTITARATDVDGGSGEGTLAVSVNQVAPALAISGASSVNEGSSYTLNLSSSDPGADTISSWTIDWGDGNVQTISGNPASLTHVYADGANSYTISASATDEDGAYAAGDTVAVTVNDVPPVVAIDGPGTVAEESSYRLDLSVIDPGADTISSWTIDWGDGNVQTISGNPGSVTHVYAYRVNDYTISATATSEDGTYAAGNTVTVRVNRMRPDVSISGPASVPEGSSYTLSLSSTGPGLPINFWTIDWGDGNVQTVSGNPATITHVYADGPADWTISAMASDDDGSYMVGNTVAVHVGNVAPALTISGAGTIIEGSIYTLDLSSTDPGADTISSWTIDWGDGNVQTISGDPTSVTHVYADGPNSYTISAAATDQDGTYSAANTVAVMVNDVAPTLSINGPASTSEGSSYTLNLSSSDPGADTISSWTIDWGDGNVQTISGDPALVTHTYTTQGVYLISASVTDDDGTYAVGNTVAVDVRDVPPMVIAGLNPGAKYEGSSYAFNLGSFADPGSGDGPWTIDINWGDGSAHGGFAVSSAGSLGSLNHTYADSGSYTLTITVTDKDGTSGSVSSTVGISNVAPVLSISGDSSANEGSSYMLNLSSGDAGTDTISSWTIDWGDGNVQTVSGNPASVTHVYADGASNHTISASASDEDGSYAAGNSVAVTVNNVPPVLSISGPASATGGAVYTLTLSHSDVGSDTISLWTIDWGDGNIQMISGSPASVTHVYVDGPASYTISASATDEDGTYAAGNSVAVTVTNMAPVVTAGSNAGTRYEGGSYAWDLGSFTDAANGADWTIDINWGDGSAHSVFTVSSAGSLGALSHSYADSGSYTITTTVTDKDGASGSATSGVSISNAAPTLSISGGSSVNEGSSYALNLSSSDVGSDTISSWTINWGDGGTETISGDPASVSHVYADGAGSYTISATATDEDGTYAAGNTVVVTVNNVAPVLSISGASSVAEGATYTLSLTSSDAGTDTLSSWTINWGDGTIQTISGHPASLNHTYAVQGSYTISASATDEDGTYAAGNTVAVTVNNQAPVVTAGTNSGTKLEGTSYSFNLGSFSDVAGDGPWTIDINWGDSSAHSILTVSSAGSLGTLSHTYADNGGYTITTTVTDKDGASGSANSSVSINNVAPTLSISGTSSVSEGSSYTLSLSSSDVGSDTISSWTISWGDGDIQTISGNPASAIHVYADGANSYTISASASDEDGTYSAGNTVAVTVSNVAPTLAISGPASINEGATYALSLSSSDAGTDTISSWVIDWGDGNVVSVSGNPASVTHLYAHGPNIYTISASAADEDGTYAAGNTLQVTVVNALPVVTAGTNSGIKFEGTSYAFDIGSFTDAVSGADWTVDVDWGDGSAHSVFTVSAAGALGTLSHTYADHGNYTIITTVTDKDGGSGSGSSAVSIGNAAPALTISGASSVAEDSTYTLNLSSTDTGEDTISSWTINWGDGTTQTVSGNPAAVSHVYADGPGAYTISATATDEDGTYAAGNTVAVTVNNRPPTLSISGSSSVNEGSSYTLNLSSSDVGADTISSWTINWGDGNVQTISGNPASVSHVYADGANGYTISATATDEDGTCAAGNTVAVTVNNVAPVLSISGPASATGGAVYTLTLSHSDVGSDTISSWTIDWGDGDIQTISGSPASITHVYVDGPASYTISASATDEDGTYAAGSTVAVEVTGLAAPNNLTASPVNARSIALTWSDNSSDEGGFKIERSSDGGSTWSEIATVAANVTSYNAGGLDFASTHSFRVRAYNGGGNSSYSNTVSATTYAVPTPNNMTAQAVSGSQINLTWVDYAPNEDGFRIERSSDGGSTWSEIGTVAANTTSYSATGLSAATTYFFRVRGYISTGGTSAYSAPVSATTYAAAAPTNLQAQAVSSSQINLTWTDASNNESGFRIERSSNGGSTWSEIGTAPANATSYSATGLAAGVTYSFRVRAYNPSGHSPYSNTASATTPTSQLPDAPANLVATPLSMTEIGLAWSDNSGNESGFKIERSAQPSSGWVQIATVAANVSNYKATGLLSDSTWYFRVRAYNASGDSGYSNQASARTYATVAPANLVATPLSGSQVRLTWIDTSGIDVGVTVEWSTNQVQWTSRQLLGGNYTSYTVTGLSANTTYYFRVRWFVPSGGASAFSNVATAKTLAAAPVAGSAPFGQTRIVSEAVVQSLLGPQEGLISGRVLW